VVSPVVLSAGGLAFLAAALASAGLALLAPERLPARRKVPRLMGALAAAGSRLRPPGAGVPRDLEARIAAGGRPGGFGPRELMAAAVAATGVGMAVAAAAPGRLGPVIAVAAPVLGFVGPDLWLAKRAAERARRVRRELPAMLDLLRVTIEAGGSLSAALAEVGERVGGPLADEWRAVGREVALGAPLSHALAGMGGRLPQEEVHALVASLGRATRHGTPLAETLGAQARDARFALQRRVREEAAKAGPKIQLVVALLLVPSVLLLVAAALLTALAGSGELVPV
jgi:tight adherence protein C